MSRPRPCVAAQCNGMPSGIITLVARAARAGIVVAASTTGNRARVQRPGEEREGKTEALRLLPAARPGRRRARRRPGRASMCPRDAGSVQVAVLRQQPTSAS